MLLFIVSMLVSSFIGFIVASILYDKKALSLTFFKSVESSKLPPFAVSYIGYRVFCGLSRYNLTNKEKKLLKDSIKKIKVIVKDKPFDPYGDPNKPGLAKIFVSKDLTVMFVGDELWKVRMARALAHAFLYILKNDADVNRTHHNWFTYATRLVKDAD